MTNKAREKQYNIIFFGIIYFLAIIEMWIWRQKAATR